MSSYRGFDSRDRIPLRDFHELGELSTRAVNALAQSGYDELGQIACRSAGQIRDIPGIGKVVSEEIISFLRCQGLGPPEGGRGKWFSFKIPMVLEPDWPRYMLVSEDGTRARVGGTGEDLEIRENLFWIGERVRDYREWLTEESRRVDRLLRIIEDFGL